MSIVVLLLLHSLNCDEAERDREGACNTKRNLVKVSSKG